VVETAWAVFKLRAIWININYRYVEDELRYLFANANLKALVHQREFSLQVAALLPELPGIGHVLVIDDGTDHPDPTPSAVRYEDALTGESTVRDFGPRSGDDLYVSTPAARRAYPRAWSGGTATCSTPWVGDRPDHQRARGATRGDGREGPQRLPPHAPAHRAAHARPPRSGRS